MTGSFDAMIAVLITPALAAAVLAVLLLASAQPALHIPLRV